MLQPLSCILAPNNVTATALSPNAVNVSWGSPSDSDSMDVYNAYSRGSEEKYCRTEAGSRQCTFAGLSPSTSYEFCVQICHVYLPASVNNLPARMASLYSEGTLLGSTKDSIGAKFDSDSRIHICGPVCCISATTPSGKQHLFIESYTKQFLVNVY